MQVRRLIAKFIDCLPIRLQRAIYKVIIETRFLVFKAKRIRKSHHLLDSTTLYWIPPSRIVYQTNYVKDKTYPEDRGFQSEKMFGVVLDGDWDLTDHKFTDLDTFKAIRDRVLNGASWEDTAFYKKTLRKIEAGNFVWELRNKADLDKRCEYIDWLYANIKKNGYISNRNNNFKNTTFDEITVNIGRSGTYLFEDGQHRLSIALLLGIEVVPVMVCVRHKRWQEFREFVLSYAQQRPRGELYQPLLHPDLADIPYIREGHNYGELMKTITTHLKKRDGVMLDIGANLGFFSHKFEDLGYKCYAVELDPATYKIMDKVRIAEDKKFEAINASIFDLDYITSIQFDVVLALNIFHHFLKRKTLYNNLIELLKNLKMDIMFFEPHLPQEDQMSGAYVNYSETEFVDFIMKHASFKKFEVIYSDKNGRRVYLLSR